MNTNKLLKKDFQSENEVRWCPGCGDYAILATVQKTLADLQMARKDTVFVSGIGCAARFPYYMNTYGMHTIHGRGPAFATGIKLANPGLNVFLVTGDGDGLSIGASHLLHLFRRNIDITVLLFNNQIYGLTKGQYSPTSQQGLVAKSTPYGSLEDPINPVAFALSGGASFVARSIDNDAVHLGEVLRAAIAHKGTSFIEIVQNCVVFNDGVFDHLRDKSQRKNRVLFLKENEPLLFAEGQKGIGFDSHTLSLTVCEGTEKDSLITHQPNSSTIIAPLLAQLCGPQFPTPVGIFRRLARDTYEEKKCEQDKLIQQRRQKQSLTQLLAGTNSWIID